MSPTEEEPEASILLDIPALPAEGRGMFYLVFRGVWCGCGHVLLLLLLWSAFARPHVAPVTRAHATHARIAPCARPA